MKIADALEVIRARLAIDAAAWLVGADKLSEHQATGFMRPRYVWVPTRDGFGPPERSGGSQRQVLTRFAGLELHLWADTLDDAETRINNVIVAWLAVANTSVVFDAITWHTDSAIGRGIPVVLGMRVKVPVTRASMPTVRPTTVEHDPSGAVAGDGILQTGETT